MRNFYSVLSFFLALSGLTAVHAQDTSACNATFQATISGNTVFLRAMDSLPGVRHNWNFGDGITDNTDSFMVNHTYSAPGQYLVIQMTTDSAHNCHDSTAQLVTIAAPPPSCSVFVTETSDSVHHLYTFVANVSVTPGASDTVRWTINDTLVATGDTLIKTLTGGRYNVCALLSTSYSCQSQSCMTINPQDSLPPPPPPPADTCTINFTATAKDHNPNQYVFSIINPERYDSISWTIAGTDSLFAGPFHGESFKYAFRDTGYYLIEVTANARPGCFVQNAQVIHIDSVPKSQGNYITSYPNPATAQVSLSVTLNSSAAVAIRVYNSMGGQVLSQSASGYPGVNQITVPIANLPIGVYYIELQYGNTILRSKVQKL
ncbi:MAG TPA: PKD domain-containing protein [Puia sp.]|jgi:hypothetical protein|nr:PKD domain-containing protein [Puia sp.]